MIISEQTTLILCAGMTRSGSTWLYNTVRLLLELEYPGEVYGCWYNNYDPSHVARYHVIKLHAPNDDLAEKAEKIVTSYRDLRDIAASAWIRNWASTEEELFQFVVSAVNCHDYWVKHSGSNISYDKIVDQPLFVMQQIGKYIGLRPDLDFMSILIQIENLPAANSVADQHNPLILEQYHHPVTLLHQQHRMNGTSGYYREVLRPDLIARIENSFEPWLRSYGYSFIRSKKTFFSFWSQKLTTNVHKGRKPQIWALTFWRRCH